MAAPNFKLRYVGEFDLKHVLDSTRQCLEERGYEVHEKEYIEKVPEVEITYECVRWRDEYWKDIIEIYFHLYDVRMLSRTRTRARIFAYINFEGESGYEDLYGISTLKETPVKARVLAFLEKTVLKRTIMLKYEDVLMYDAHAVTMTIRESLGMDIGLTRREE